MGLFVVPQLAAIPNKFVKWTIQPPNNFPGGQNQVAAALRDEQAWVAVTSEFEQFFDNDRTWLKFILLS